MAAAIDVLGDLRALLVLRDLLRHGPQTIASLHARNPTLPIGRLDEILASLEQHDVVEWRSDPRGSAFHLRDETGAAGAVVTAVERFGSPLVHRRPLTPAMLASVVDDAARAGHDELVTVEGAWVVRLEVSGRIMGIVVSPGVLRADAGVIDEADVTIACTQDVFLDLLDGTVGLAAAVSHGEVSVVGPLAPAELVVHLLRRGSSR